MTAPRQQTEPASLRKRAYKAIQNRILKGELSSGDPVSDLVLSRDLGISRTPVREAISQLVAEGLLDQPASGGTIVTRLTRQDIVELYELREALETYAVRMAARRGLDPGDLAALEDICGEIAQMAAKLERGGQRRLDRAAMQRFISIDLMFHTLLLRGGGNRRIVKVVNGTRLLIRIFSIRLEGHTAALLQSIAAAHRAIVEAVKAGNAEEAVRHLAEHLRASRAERLEEFDSEERRAQMRLEDLMPFEAVGR
jgi:DNA-binding GntR family transcriptional regulator